MANYRKTKSNGHGHNTVSTSSMIRTADLQVDPKYQRGLDKDFVAAAVTNYRPELMTPLEVVRRTNGDLFVVDGQHRLAIAKERGIAELRCDVHVAKNVADEAQLFLDLNRNRRAIRTYDEFKARLEALDPIALEIEAVIHGEGLRRSPNKLERAVTAVSCVEYVHTNYKNLATVLRILTNWQDGDAAAYDGAIVRDLGAFLHEYPKAAESRTIAALQTTTPRELKRKVKTVNADFVGTRQEAAVRVLRTLYNSQCRGRGKLTRQAVGDEA